MRTLYENKYIEIGICPDQWFLLPTVTYEPKKYRYSWSRPMQFMFLTFYMLIGKERGT